MRRRADACDGCGTEFPEAERSILLIFLRAEGGMDLFVFHLAEQRGEGDKVNGRAHQGKVLRQLPEYRRKQVQFCLIMASDLKRYKMFMPSKPFFCGQGCLEDQLCVCQEQDSFLSQRHAFACPVEKLYFQLIFQ